MPAKSYQIDIFIVIIFFGKFLFHIFLVKTFKKSYIWCLYKWNNNLPKDNNRSENVNLGQLALPWPIRDFYFRWQAKNFDFDNSYITTFYQQQISGQSFGYRTDQF